MRLKFLLYEAYEEGISYVYFKITDHENFPRYTIYDCDEVEAVCYPEITRIKIFLLGDNVEQDNYMSRTYTRHPVQLKYRAILWILKYFRKSGYYENVAIKKISNQSWEITGDRI